MFSNVTSKYILPNCDSMAMACMKDKSLKKTIKENNKSSRHTPLSSFETTPRSDYIGLHNFTNQIQWFHSGAKMKRKEINFREPKHKNSPLGMWMGYPHPGLNCGKKIRELQIFHTIVC